MGARAKLNQAHFNGALVISGIIAAVLSPGHSLRFWQSLSRLEHSPAVTFV